MANQTATTYHWFQMFAGHDLLNPKRVTDEFDNLTYWPSTVPMFWLAGSTRSQQKVVEKMAEFKVAVCVAL